MDGECGHARSSYCGGSGNKWVCGRDWGSRSLEVVRWRASSKPKKSCHRTVVELAVVAGVVVVVVVVVLALVLVLVEYLERPPEATVFEARVDGETDEGLSEEPPSNTAASWDFLSFQSRANS